MLTDSQILAKYGKPGDFSNFTFIKLPYPMRIAWDLTYSINKMQCHHLVAENFETVFKQLLANYGLDELQKLGIDLYGGCVNVRPMRGTEKYKNPRWSRHAWGIAVDLDPDRNRLRTPWRKSQFSKPEYKQMMDIFYKNGFINYGKEKDYDSMHFEISS